MNFRRLHIVQFAGLLFLGVLLVGCLGRSAPQVNYYSLMTMEQMGETETEASFPAVTLGIGPIMIPDSLKRSQIVTRKPGNLYTFNEFNRWAGLVEEDLAVVIGDNLGQLLGVDKMVFFPWLPFYKPDYRVIVKVQRLDGDLTGDAVLSARWTVADATGDSVLAGGKGDFRQALEEPTYVALVEAESQLVAALSRDIAKALVRIRKGQG